MKPKKVIAAILAGVSVFTLAACGGKKDVEQPNEQEQQVEEVVNPVEEEITTEENKEETPKPEDKKEEPKPTPSETKQPEKVQTPTPEVTPTVEPKPQETPVPEEQDTTVGQKLLKDFYGKAASASSALSLAEAIASNSILPFSAASMLVEPGLLSGFGNTEINGFKEGATFGPIIGSVPFVGYVFVLEEGTNASNFISTLKSNADLRWNICVEADEMVAGSSGNKVFFVMCPKDFSQEG